jgi:eukaryotic-like serine/threonine-protein kinase
MGSASGSDGREPWDQPTASASQRLLDEPSWDPAEESVALAKLKRGLFPQRSAMPPRLERYALSRKLGAGAGGSVHAAWDPRLGREVAIKLVRSRRAPDHVQAERDLVREARALARLAHPNVVNVFDVGRYDPPSGLPGSGGVFIVMELVRGETLRAWLEQPRTWQEICTIIIQAARGVAAAHEVGVVHRDLKPSNLLVGGDGRLRVADFGIAHLTRAPAEARAHDEGTITGVHREDGRDEETTAPGERVIAGTPRYMAPEQHRGETPDARADQYALCVTAFEALVGQPPFQGTTLAELRDAKHLGQIAVPPGSRVPRRLLRVLERGLAVAPQDRHPSMDALATALLRCLRRPRPSALAVVTGSALAIGVAAATMAPSRAACNGASRMAATYGADDRRAAVRAFVATGAPHAAVSWARVDDRLSRFASEWIDAYETACTAVITDRRAGRLRCLDGGRFEVDALVAMLRDANTETVTRAAELIEELPQPSRCLSAEPVGRANAADLLQRALARAYQKKWAGFAVERRAGRYHTLEHVLLRELEAVRSLGDGPLLVEALVTTGDVLAEVGRIEEAEALLEEAYWYGLESGSTHEAARAAVRLVAVTGGARPDEALDWVRHAEALIDRHPDLLVAGRLWSNVADVLELADRLEEGQAAIDRAIALLEQVPPEQRALPIAAAFNIRGNLAVKRDALTDAEADYVRAHAALQHALGPEHPDTAKALSNVARVLIYTGHFDDGRLRQREALRHLEAALGADHDAVATALVALAQIEELAGLSPETHARAMASMRRAVAIVRRRHEPSHPLRTKIEAEHARLVLLGGQIDAAVALLDSLIATLERAYGEHDSSLVYPLILRADGRGFTGDVMAQQQDRDRAARICEERPSPTCP